MVEYGTKQIVRNELYRILSGQFVVANSKKSSFGSGCCARGKIVMCKVWQISDRLLVIRRKIRTLLEKQCQGNPNSSRFPRKSGCPFTSCGVYLCLPQGVPVLPAGWPYTPRRVYLYFPQSDPILPAGCTNASCGVPQYSPHHLRG